jgi:SSS family solute:Na+ symporter
MSTADSCLIAASGNLVTDIIGRFVNFGSSHKRILLLSQIMTLVLGIFALFLASNMQNVLELMLYSYAFMVSGLFIPIIGAFYWKRSSATAALWAMLIGGGTTITLIITNPPLPFGLDPNIFGITASALIFIVFSYIFPTPEVEPNLSAHGLAKT